MILLHVLRGLRSDAALAVLAACGIPPGLASEGGTAQGAREDFRRFILASVEPLLKRVVEEFELKLETKISIDLSALMAHDVVSRSRHFLSSLRVE